MEKRSTSDSGLMLTELASKRPLYLHIVLFPGEYIQGRRALDVLGELVCPLSRNVLVLGGGRALGSSQERIEASLKRSGITFEVIRFAGECTEEEIARASQRAKETGAGMIVGVGGGKALDAAKAVAAEVGLGVTVVPTIASTDAPVARLAVIYSKNGRFSHYLRFPKGPDIVVVDTEVIAKAPSRFLVAGMGGALGMSYEAEAAAEARAKNMAGGLPFNSVVRWAVLCREIILEYGLMAKVSAERGLATPALEAVVEANILLSGIGSESGGMAVALGVYHGFRAVVPELDKLHGEIVAYGTLVQLVLENRPKDEILKLFSFLRAVGLPYRLEHLGLHEREESRIKRIAEEACEAGTTRNMPFRVDSDKMLDAILLVNEIGNQIDTTSSTEAKRGQGSPPRDDLTTRAR